MSNADHDRWPKVADIANAYLEFASTDAALVNGAVLPV
jgi:hypothetical protein